MSYKNLKDFVKKEALRGESPDKLREGLILHGWDKEDVDRVINEVYGLKKKIKNLGTIIIIFLIIIFSVSLILVFLELQSSEETKPISEQEEQEIKEEQIIEKSGCASIDNINEKEDCYLEKIEQGFGCEDLSEEEQHHCIRILDHYLMDLFS